LAVDIHLSDPNLQIYNGRLHIRAQLHGLSYYCYHYFFTSLIIGTLCIFFVELFFVIVLVLAVILVRYNKRTEHGDLVSHDLHETLEPEDARKSPSSSPAVSPGELNQDGEQQEESSSESGAAGTGISFPTVKSKTKEKDSVHKKSTQKTTPPAELHTILPHDSDEDDKGKEREV